MENSFDCERRQSASSIMHQEAETMECCLSSSFPSNGASVETNTNTIDGLSSSRRKEDRGIIGSDGDFSAANRVEQEIRTYPVARRYANTNCQPESLIRW